MTASKTKTKPEAKEAQGTPTITSRWLEKMTSVTPETVPLLQENIHCKDALNNIIRQVFPGQPEIWVTDADDETDLDLTAHAKEEFTRLKGYGLMQATLMDHWEWGPFIHSDGIEKTDGEYRISEIRHLPCSTFNTIPTGGGGKYAIPNPLTPGIVVNTEGEVEVWQTDQFTANQTKLDNVQIVTAHGTPDPSGAAYLYPVYHAIAQIDFASKAEFQQLARIGAPPLLPKAIDNIQPGQYEKLNKWFKEFLKKWGKDTSALLPPGIEFPTLNIKEGTVAERFIQARIDWIRTYTNPISDMQQAGTGIGTSDSGRMEIWATYIASEQSACEGWLEDLFDYVLEANGYEGYHTHIRLKRPSVDKAALRLQYIAQAYNSKAITTKEIRDNMTDILDLPEWSPELEIELKNQYPQGTALGMFGNTAAVEGFTRAEDKAMTQMAKGVADINTKTAEAISRIMNYPSPE